jgi:hypothetical protein
MGLIMFKKVLLLLLVFLLLVAGASAVKFVINDDHASLSLAATEDHEVAFSNVVAENPDSYSATMSADDSGGATASQDSNVDGADFIFTASAGISPDGDSSYTYTETYGGSSSSSQEGHAGQGSSSVEQETTSVAVAGASVSGANDSEGNTATESNAFVLGVNHVEMTANTDNSATATQDGLFVGLSADTLGIAEAKSGAISTTGSVVGGGLMVYNGTATAGKKTTNATQDVFMVSGLGSAFAASDDQKGNTAFQSVSFVGGILDASQSANTDHSASASQSGTFAGLVASTTGLAHSKDGDLSTTNAGVFTGLMAFDDTATASKKTTTASQDVAMAGLAGSANALSIDHSGNVTSQSSGFALGGMDVTQQANTSASAHATQSGTITAALGGTSGLAVSDGEVSWTDADIVLGSMTFDNYATADGHTYAGQDVGVPFALYGEASATSFNGVNLTSEKASLVLGTMDVTQQANTSASAHATQSGTITAALGGTSGLALSDGEVSATDADIVLGTMTFDNNATADGHTIAGQAVDMAALYGNASAVSDDGKGNVTVEGSGIVLGSMSTSQLANTTGSANAVQSGDMSALYGFTWGNATSGDEQSWTKADILVGTMTFDNNATADGHTTAGQAVDMSALYGNASAGSDDAKGNVTVEGSGIVLGSMSTSQLANTTGSAHAVQSGDMSALYGFTWGNATSGDEQSWTKADILVGTMTFDNNATADGHTTAGQAVDMAALYGNASAGSDDAKGNVTVEGSGIILGNLTTSQLANTTGSAHAVQSGDMSALYGFTWGNATSGDEQSWTKADILVGTMTFDNNATADGHTTAGQAVDMSALYGNASAGSDDAKGNVTVEGSGIILGNLTTSQLANTTGSAHAVQSGDMSALYGFTWGNATSGDEQSWTKADILVGTMTFDNNATADGHTSAGQTVQVPFAVAANASAGSDDGMGKVVQEGVGVILSTLSVSQQFNTSGSAHGVQSGTMTGVGGNTWGSATDGSNTSWTKADVIVGVMNFTNTADAGATTSASQSVQVPLALLGNASAGSSDDTDTAEVGAGYLVGISVDVNQQANTSASAHANQSGSMFAGYGFTWGNATSPSDNEQSWSNGNVLIGTMTFENNATAGSSTEAGQSLVLIGLNGSAISGSTEGTNSAEVGTEIIGGDLTGLLGIDLNTINLDDLLGLVGQVVSNVGGGYLDVNQQANTSSSAHASQSGTLISLGDGRTWSTATSGPDEKSWTATNVTSGIITLNSNTAEAGASTLAKQDVYILGLSASSSAGSMDGTSRTEVGTEISNGTLNLDTLVTIIEDPSAILDVIGDILSGDIGSGIIDMEQQANTSSSAHANQSGTVTTFADGRIWGEAQSGDVNRSWTEAGVSSNGIPAWITVNSNSVTAGPKTSAAQNLEIAAPGGLLLNIPGGTGYAQSGSVNEVNGNYAIVGAGFTNARLNVGTLKVNQTTETDSLPGYAKANQTAQIGSSVNIPILGWTATSFVNTSWTLAQAGNNLGVNASIGTTGSGGSVNIRTETAGAIGGVSQSYVSEQKTRLSGSTSSIAYANNTLGSDVSLVRTGATTNGYAWAESVLRKVSL